MTHTGYTPDSEGGFGEFKQCSGESCRRCHSNNVQRRTWESYDGAYEDYNYRCFECGAQWWVDGIDS